MHYEIMLIFHSETVAHQAVMLAYQHGHEVERFGSMVKLPHSQAVDIYQYLSVYDHYLVNDWDFRKAT